MHLPLAGKGGSPMAEPGGQPPFDWPDGGGGSQDAPFGLELIDQLLEALAAVVHLVAQAVQFPGQRVSRWGLVSHSGGHQGPGTRGIRTADSNE